METCSRCRKKLGWSERNSDWNDQLKGGYIQEPDINGNWYLGEKREFPDYKGKKLCQSCVKEVFVQLHYEQALRQALSQIETLETAGTYEEAAVLYEKFGMYKEAGEMRKKDRTNTLFQQMSILEN